MPPSLVFASLFLQRDFGHKAVKKLIHKPYKNPGLCGFVFIVEGEGISNCRAQYLNDNEQ